MTAPDLDALLDALAERIAAKLADRVGSPAPRAASEYMTRRQAREQLAIEERVLIAAERAGLPTFKSGRTKTYRREDLVALVERSRVQPKAESEDAQLDDFERARRRAVARRAAGGIR